MKFEGIMPPVITPLTKDRMVDEKGYATVIEYMIDSGVHAIIAGGTILRKEKFDELPPDLQDVFQSTADRAHELLNKIIRQDDEKAYRVVLKKGIQVIDAGDAMPEWNAAYKKVRDNFTGRLFPKSLLDAVSEAAKP